MLIVRPVPIIETAVELCKLCGIEHKSDLFTYFAADANDDATEINHIIGVCTFTIKGNVNRIESLSYAPGIEDDEAMIIMARTVMNFMYRCEVKRFTVNRDGVSPELVRKLGFKTLDADESIDLERFYKEPCKYNG